MLKVWINGIELHYEEAGEGPPVVFLHGGFASLANVLRELKPYDWSWEWDFARHFRFVWYDRRGCYRSSLPEDDDFSLTTQAQDLEQLLDRLCISSAHIVASSAGGPIAICFAATRPDRVRLLVLVGTGLNLFPQDDPFSQTLRALIRTLEVSGPEAAYDRGPRGWKPPCKSSGITRKPRLRESLKPSYGSRKPGLSRPDAFPRKRGCATTPRSCRTSKRIWR